MSLGKPLLIGFFVLLAGGALMVALGVKVPVPQIGRDYVLHLLLPDRTSDQKDLALPKIAGPTDASRPLVVIDAGHGGRDPGAVNGKYREKDITLGLARALRDNLVNGGGIRVALTREDDRLIGLADRPEIARKMNADLFVSIHADSAGELGEARGASVYTLSRKASSAAAARFAKRENDADRVNGLSIKGQDKQVSAILVELSQRKSQGDAAALASLILREGRGKINFVRDPKRSADLVVLRSPDVPSALFESGFISDRGDVEKLATKRGQEEIANILGDAVRIYFIRRDNARRGEG